MGVWSAEFNLLRGKAAELIMTNATLLKLFGPIVSMGHSAYKSVYPIEKLSPNLEPEVLALINIAFWRVF